jgi:RNA polymerase sigma factor (sigma-70 family)
METDSDLLSKYVKDRSEAAFAEVVRRHVDLVYSAACREMSGDASIAQDVTQMVFIELARKAHRLMRHPALAGWLYVSVRCVSANFRRRERRRIAREEEGSRVNDSFASEKTEPSWEELAPVLDDALHQLREADRNALILRFLKENSLREVGTALGLTENAARMRVDRALEKLRHSLAKHGVVSSATGLTTALAAGSMISAPTSMGATVTAGVLAATASGTSVATTGITTLKFITMTKGKFGIIAAITAVTIVAPLVVSHQSLEAVRTENQSLRQIIAQLESPRGEVTNSATSSIQTSTVLPDQFQELMKLRSEVGELRASRNKAASDQEIETLQAEIQDLNEQIISLTNKTNSLTQSLFGYINAYSNSIPIEKRWAYTVPERKRYSLAPSSDGGYELQYLTGDAKQISRGKISKIGTGENHLFVAFPATNNGPDIWKIIDLRSGSVNGPYEETELMSRNEVAGVRFMTPAEAWNAAQ